VINEKIMVSIATLLARSKSGYMYCSQCEFYNICLYFYQFNRNFYAEFCSLLIFCFSVNIFVFMSECVCTIIIFVLQCFDDLRLCDSSVILAVHTGTSTIC